MNLSSFRQVLVIFISIIHNGMYHSIHNSQHSKIFSKQHLTIKLLKPIFLHIYKTCIQ